MRITEKLAQKKEKEIHLYKEGVFWVAYEEAAYLISQVKRLKPTKKYIKSIQQEVVSVGFPPTSLAGVLAHFTLKKQEDTIIVLENDVPVEASLYNKWKQAVEIKKQGPQGRQSVYDEGVQVLVERIGSFKLHMASPMDCMRFVEKLQQDFCS